MNTEKSVNREDDGEQNSHILKRTLKRPLGMPVTMLTMIFILPVIANWFFYSQETVANIAPFRIVVLIHSAVAVFFILALWAVYGWSHTSSYDKFCDWFYKESRRWSYAGLTVTVILAIFAFLIQNALVLNSVEEAGQPFIIFSWAIPYASVMFIAWQVLISLLFFMFYFRIDRSLEITDSADKWLFLPMFTFAFAPIFSAFTIVLGKADGVPKFLTDVMLFVALLAATVSTFFIWAYISRTHDPQDTETRPSGHGKKLRKSLRKHLSKQWGMYQQLQRWRWDRRFPQRRERTVGMFA